MATNGSGSFSAMQDKLLALQMHGVARCSRATHAACSGSTFAPGDTRPVEMWPGVGFPPGSNVAVTDDSGGRVVCRKCRQEAGKPLILRLCKGLGVAAFKLDADGKIIAAFASLPAGNTGMPGAGMACNELDQVSGATDEEVRGNAAVGDRCKVGVRQRIEPVGEKVGDGVALETVGGQADRMDDDQIDVHARGTGIMVRAGDMFCFGKPAGVIALRHGQARDSLMPSRSMR